MKRKWQDIAFSVFLSMVFPGLGEVKGGRPRAGLLIIITMLCINLIWIFVTHHPVTLFLTVLLYGVLRVGSPILAGFGHRQSIGRWWRFLLVIPLLYILDFGLAEIAENHTSPVLIPISGESMLPQIHDGDRVLVEQQAEIQRGDLVNIVDKEGNLIKRVIAMPCERVEIRNLGTYIDGQLIPEPYALFDSTLLNPDGWNLPQIYRDMEFHVGPDSFFFMGDNRFGSFDSRMTGALPIANIEGRALFVAWPLRRAGLKLR